MQTQPEPTRCPFTIQLDGPAGTTAWARCDLERHHSTKHRVSHTDAQLDNMDEPHLDPPVPADMLEPDPELPACRYCGTSAEWSDAIAHRDCPADCYTPKPAPALPARLDAVPTIRRRPYVPRCPECGRRFDLTNPTDAAEWTAGHDCEA